VYHTFKNGETRRILPCASLVLNHELTESYLSISVHILTNFLVSLSHTHTQCTIHAPPNDISDLNSLQFKVWLLVNPQKLRPFQHFIYLCMLFFHPLQLWSQKSFYI